MSPQAAATMLFPEFVGAAVLVALWERARALRNERRLRRERTPEIAPSIFRLMVPVYALIFPAAVAEHVVLARRPAPALAAAMVLLFAAAKMVKCGAIRRLGDAWTMKVFVPRDLRVATGGPYRFVRHPVYAAVAIEILALPLAGGAWITAAAGAALFAPLLWARIRTEERALLDHPGYAAAMAARGRR